jgi:hypothetical protein
MGRGEEARLTIEFLPKMTPFGLTRNTMPFAVSVPMICDGSVSPVTRLRAMALALGWAKLTVALEPMLKVFQLVIRFCEDWLTVSVLVLELVV